MIRTVVGAFVQADHLLLAEPGAPGRVVELALGAGGDAGHGLDDGHRIDADGRLAGQHHRARAVEDGVGDVGHLGTRAASAR